MALSFEETINSLTPVWPDDLLPAIQQENAKSPTSIVVLDDDPTGTQTVHDVPVVTNWALPTITDEFKRETPLFYVLTNSRGLPRTRAINLAREVGANILEASRRTGRAFEIISRSDSTLRGHFPDEVDALIDVLEMQRAVWLIIPFFEEGGRYTINDIHYVKEAQHLIPAAETPFAKDAVFGYTHSNLRHWVEEKTQGRCPAESVQSVSLDEIRKEGPDSIASKLAGCEPGSVCVVNAADYRDLEVVSSGLLQAQRQGQRFLFRTAASFVRVRAGLKSRPLLTANEMNLTTGSSGLIVVGSYVPRSSEQLSHLLQHTNEQSIELNIETLLSMPVRDELIRTTIKQIENVLSQGKDIVVYTSRKLITGNDDESSLHIGEQISQALVEIVRSIHVRPGYILAKGGITSSDIATKALKITRAQVLGQILPGVPVWRTGPESTFPDLPYIVFPGNVGGSDAITHVVKGLRPSVSS
ncbi:MAG: hypothetical protein JXM79_08145 [Sedimentisphaerales bacterium]|nr:hypothetical protein [Sedimentisphaerales bacterium]